MNSLEFVYQTLRERDDTSLLHDIEMAIQQRDRLLYGYNARMAELNSLAKEYDLLKERYRLMNQRCEHLHIVNNELLADLKRYRITHKGTLDE